MRKRTISNLIDSIIWALIILMPIVFGALICVRTGVSITIPNMFTSIGIDLATDNAIYNTLISIFGVGGSLPLFTSNSVILLMTWFVIVELLHLVIDCLLYIPRICQKWLHKGVE